MENIPPEWSDYIKILGTERILSFSYLLSKHRLDKEVARKKGEIENKDTLREKLIESFEAGKAYSPTEVKDIIKGIYDSLGIEPKNKCYYIRPTLSPYFKIVKSNTTTGRDRKKDNFYRLYPLTSPDTLNSDMNIKTI
jgi:hypothetical protein